MIGKCEYVIDWYGIGAQLTSLLKGNVPFVLWPKRIREERLREPIVRCGNCKWFDAHTEPCLCYRLDHSMFVDANGFCAWGKWACDDR